MRMNDYSFSTLAYWDILPAYESHSVIDAAGTQISGVLRLCTCYSHQ